MLLLVAVQQRPTWIVGHHVEFDRLIARHAYHIFADARGRLPLHIDELKAMPMQVHRMHVAAVVAEQDTLAFPPVHEQGSSVRP